MPGHVFVTRGDLTAIACDAWLLPGNDDDGPGTRRKWLTTASGLQHQFEGGRLQNPVSVKGCDRVWRLARAADHAAPQAFLVNTGGHHGLALSWYLDGLEQFLAALRTDGDRWRVGLERERPLIGVPMIGTGEGGADQTRGGIVKAVLQRLYRAAAADDLGADFALVTYREPDFAAAQWARKTMSESTDPWPDLEGTGLDRVAARLGAEARAGRLVLFIGAGVSAAAGLPLWNELIDRLAKRAGIGADDRAQLVKRLPVLDQARIVEARLQAERSEKLGDAVKAVMDATRPALSHLLLASLPVREVATTNYDELFEFASTLVGRPAAQLPYSPDPSTERWVLKLHGTVGHPDEIVLTREDYLAYHDQRAALAGIVQGLLITKHMLFVGFSFSDDNFHRIVYDVRKAMRPRGSRALPNTFGTALLLDDDDLRRKLWEGELEFASTQVEGDVSGSPLPAARRLEIFLDRLLSEATTNSTHLLDRTYDELLSPGERRLRDAFTEFLESARPSSEDGSHAWDEISRLARELGASPVEP